MKSFLRDLAVIVFAAVILAIAILFFTGSIKVHAAQVIYTTRTLSETRGNVTVTTCDAHTQFEYHNDDYVACGTMQATETRTEANKAIVEPTITATPDMPAAPAIETPETPIVIDDGGETITEDTTDNTPPTVSENGNPGNDKAVGHAGEKCDKGLCENADGVTGEKGKSNND